MYGLYLFMYQHIEWLDMIFYGEAIVYEQKNVDEAGLRWKKSFLSPRALIISEMCKKELMIVFNKVPMAKFESFKFGKQV